MNHDHSDTRLSCIDCAEPVCPKCMVQCAVGNRCKKCAGKFSTHMVKITPIVMVKVVLLSFVSAFLILAAQMIVSMTIPVCMVGSLAAAGTAYFLGGFIHKVSGYKDGRLLTPFILVPLIIGFLLNPFGGLLAFIQLMTISGAAFNFTFLLPLLVTPIVSCFLIMVQPNQIRTK